MSTRCFTMLLMVFAGVVSTARCKSATDSIVPQGPPPDPTLLPAATGQEPDTTAYKILNVAAQPAGFSYPDPVSRVRVWKVTSATVPLANTGAGHDYSEGGNEVSRAWGPNHDTHTIMILAFAGNSSHWLVDFTRGVGFANYRRLTVQPDRDGCASFSNLVGQERILYIHNGGQLVRYNTATMRVENTGHFPLTVSTYAWLQQDRNDVWFAGLLTDNKTVWVWNSRTNQLLTHLETWTNEPYLERNGRYLIMTSGGPSTTTRVWDLSSNTFGAVQAAPDVQFHVSHAAIARGFVVALNPNGDAQERYDVVANAQIAMTQLYPNDGGDAHHSGNWIQTDAELGGNLDKQWTYVSGGSGPEYSGYPTLQWKLAIGVQRSDGSDQRLLVHTYDPSPYPNYYDYAFGKPSPDGKVVLFNSKMLNQAGRWDLFVAEVPLH